MSPPDFPGIPTRNMSAPKIRTSSIIPAALAEAGGAKFSVSLLLIIALVSGSYLAGRDAGRGVARPEISELMSVHDRRLENIARSLEAIRDGQELHQSSLYSVDTRVSQINTEVQVIKSHLSK